MSSRTILTLFRNISTTSSEKGGNAVNLEQIDLEHTFIRRHLRAITHQTTIRYQIFVVVLNCLIWFQIAYTSMLGSFVFMNPLFSCSGKELSEVEACKNINVCAVENKFTATFSHGLYCQQSDTRVLIQAVFPIGCLVGLFSLPGLSDRKGRRFTFLTGLALQIIGACLLLFGLTHRSIIMICIGHFLTGVFASGCSIATYVISSEALRGFLRQSSIMLYNAVWGFSLMSFYWIIDYLPEWNRYITNLIILPALLTFIAVYWRLLQTPDYLLTIKRSPSEYMAMMKDMAVRNSLPFEKYVKVFDAQSTYQKILQRLTDQNDKQEEGKQKKGVSAWEKITRKGQIVKAIVCLAFGLFGYNIFYFGMQGSMERAGYSYGVNMLLAGSHQFVAFLVAGAVVPKINRKTGLIIFNLLSALAGLCFIVPFVEKSLILQTLILSFVRITAVFSCSLFSVLQTETFEASIKSTAIGLTSGFSQIGRVAIPVMIDTMNKIGIHPLVAASFLYLLLGIIPVLFLKETYEEEDETDDDEVYLKKLTSHKKMKPPVLPKLQKSQSQTNLHYD